MGKKYDLSILIPARNEMFISRTVDDILKNKRGNTEIIVGLDGAWAEPGIVDHPDVRIVYSPEPKGQRGMTNLLAKMSKAKYVAKSDAHCAFDEGFDVKLMDAMQGHDNWTIVPLMRNLHAFDWKCMKCGKKTYQGPTPGTHNGITKCEDCGNTDYSTFKRKIVWYAKPSPQSTAYCFDPEPHFQYFNEFKRRPEGQGDITPTMSLQGSFFMLTRDKYWELNISDEKTFGSWGSQGIEVACKTWLTGGEVMCIQNTWYAHMFRTQGGDFSFPYEQKQSKVNEAKRKAKNIFFEGSIPGQVRPLSWLVEKFWPINRWTEQDLIQLKEMEKKPLRRGILYFTDNELTLKVAKRVQKRIVDIAEELDLELVSSSRKSMEMGKNVTTDGPRGYKTMFQQILKGLEAMDADIVYMAEHDVMYPKEHFEFIPERKDKVYYDHNWWKVYPDHSAYHWDADQVSGIAAYKDVLLNHYRKVVEEYDDSTFNRRFEPFSRGKSLSWKAPKPHIDIRHGNNLTKGKKSLSEFRDKSTAVNFTQSTLEEVSEEATTISKML